MTAPSSLQDAAADCRAARFSGGILIVVGFIGGGAILRRDNIEHSSRQLN